MPNPRSARTSRALIAVGVVSSLCALAASYLYLVSPDTSLSSAGRPAPSRRKRQTILISAASPDDFLTHIPESAMLDDDLTFLHFDPDGHDPAELNSRCAYLLRHEKVEGLTHIARHMAPDIVLVLPTMAESVKTADLKDWVGRIIVVHDASQDGTNDLVSTNQVKHITSGTPYAQFITQT